MAKNIQKISLKKKLQLSPEEYLEGILAKNTTILSRAITLVESSKDADITTAEQLIELCLPYAGKSTRIGVTGVPGVGKSTFIETLGSMLIEKHQKKVAVLAIDPSSDKNHGSILGDKTRMAALSSTDNAFVRPSPSSGTLGGVAKATRETIILCEAAGFDTILIETVGVGQSEIAVKSMVDFFLLLMLPGAGDELQGIKRGIMEMADTIVINKADGDNIKKVQLAQNAYKNSIHLFLPNDNGWIPKVCSTSALKQTGIEEVIAIIDQFTRLTKSNNWFNDNRKSQAKYWLDQTINHSLKKQFYSLPSIKKELASLEQKVMEGKMSPFKAAEQLLTLFGKEYSNNL